MCAVVRVRCSLAVVEHLEAVPRPFLGQKACDKYRKRGLVPGVLKGLGAGYFDIPIALRISDLVSFRERGGFLNREYKLVRLLLPSCSSCNTRALCAMVLTSRRDNATRSPRSSKTRSST